MTDSEIYSLLFSGGNYTKPWLVRFSHPAAGTVLIVNDNRSVTFRGETYRPGTFTYTPPDSSGEGGALEIALADNEDLMEFVENADDRLMLEVTGIIAENGEVAPVRAYRHFFGSVSLGDSWSLSFTLGRDDRLDMVFNPLKYDADTNRGNI